MNCCNYVQPYPAHGHFYHHQQQQQHQHQQQQQQQQQHNFCYDNTNVYGAGAYGINSGVGRAPVSDTIESNASRYNRLPPAYPTDYVYNPKEARLRKAMREQSRELSRQTILQTAIASAAGNTSVGGPGCGGNGVTDNISPSLATGSTNFLNHPLNCSASVVNGQSIASATVSSLPGSPSFNTGNRIINPWFPTSHGPSTNHLKPILSPRVMTVAQHQQQQQHRTFDKTKEVLRKQAECAAFSAASNPPTYSNDFSGHPNSGNLSGHQSSSHESNDYCVIAEFSDGQKWHPYQNGPTPYHSRPGGTLSKMGNHQPAMQSNNPHAHTGWNQFCNVPLSNIPRGPRHMVFLQEQQQNQHCGFPDEMQMPYLQNKHMDISHRLHPSYSQQEHQSKLQSNSMSPLNMSQLRDPEKSRMEDGPRWESNGAQGGGCSNESSIAMRSKHESESKIQQDEQEQERTSGQDDVHQLVKNREQQQQQREQRYNGESPSPSETKHKKSGTISKQPLPGFHQAFGSTEIGRFSRSEYFANMVGGEANNVSNISQNSCNSSSSLNDRTIEIVENCVNDDLEDSSSSSNNILADNCSIVTRGKTNSSSSSSSSRNRRGRRDSHMDDCNSQGSGSNDNTNNAVIDRNNDSTSFNNSLTIGENYYNDDRNMGPSGGRGVVGIATIPRWHSPYVNAIGSET